LSCPISSACPALPQTDQQFCDRGRQYRSAIFFHSDAQRQAALASKVKYDELGVFGTGALGRKLPLVTEITPVRQTGPLEPSHRSRVNSGQPFR